MTKAGMDSFLRSWPIAILGAYVVFYLTGIYRGFWRYFGLSDLLRFLLASILSGVVVFLAIELVYRTGDYPVESFALFSVFLFLSLSGSRVSFSILDRLQFQQKSQQNHPGLLIYGAGDIGEVLVRWLLRGSEFEFRPLGFIDNNEKLWGRAIHGPTALVAVDDRRGDSLKSVIEGDRPATFDPDE